MARVEAIAASCLTVKPANKVQDLMSPVQLVELKCKNCGSALSPEDISPQLAAARCGHCNALFAIPQVGVQAIRRPDVPLPKGFHLERGMDSVTITRRWFGPVAFFLLFFALFWNGFMIVWHSIALGKGMWIMSAFGLLHTGVGVFLVYYVLALFLNSTVIRATAFELVVTTGPLPWKGDKRIAAETVEQLFCMEKISRGKNGSSASYRVEAVLRGNVRETLARGFTDPDQALFVEQEIERHLKITDVPVPGECGR